MNINLILFMISNKKIQKQRNKKIAILLFCVLSMTKLFGQNSLRVDPPFWFKGMKNPHLQLMVHLSKTVNKLEKVECSESSINQNFKYKLSVNNNYVFIDLDIPADLKLELIKFKIHVYEKSKLKTFNINYEIKTRPNSQPINGVDASDFIYMLMPDRFSNGDQANDNNAKLLEPKSDRKQLKTRHGGDIQGIINHLDYIQELGITALWPSPVLENNQPKESYHGYAITDHYAVDPRFGTLDLYLNLKKEAEKRGIKLIKDVIYNHIGNEHYLFKNKPANNWFNHWDTFTRTSYKATTLIDPYASDRDKKEFSDGWFDHHMPDLNQNNPDLANYLIQNTIWWIECFGINGLRIDTYTYPDQSFMKSLLQAVLQEYPSIGIFGETWVQGNPLQAYFVQKNPCLTTDPMLPGVTDFQVYFAVSHALTNDFGWTEGLNRIYHTLAEDYLYKDPLKNVLFLDNHDLSRFYSVVGEDVDKLKMGIGFMMTTRGIPSIYYGTEILMKNFSQPDALVREDFPGGWQGDSLNKFIKSGRTVQENEMFEFVKKLATYRKKSSVLQTGKLKQFIPRKGVYVYCRYNELNEKVLVVMNQNNDQETLELSRFSEIIDTKNQGIDIVSNKTYTFESNLILAPKSILILEIQKK